MEHVICINTNSFPALTSEDACSLLLDSLYGILELNTGQDKFIFCLDSNKESLSDLVVSDGFLYSDFVANIKNLNMDLYQFLLEVEDKSPVLDMLTEDEFESIAKYDFYVKDHAVKEDTTTDIYSIAWCLSATLLSINTNQWWDTDRLEISRVAEDGRYIEDEYLHLHNISRYEHGKSISALFIEKKDSIKDILSDNHVTKEFLEWYHELTSDNKKRVIDKLTLSCIRKFSGGEPLFKNLHDADGLREIRFNAYPGGTIRVLFKAQDNNQAILLGFIKKSSSEGYDYAIDKANGLFPIQG